MDKITLFRDEKQHAQVEHYNKHVLPLCKEAEWLLVCDLDEFIYARKSFKTITEYLQALPDHISAVRVPWKIFGSSGYKDQPKRVVRSFLMREHFNNKPFEPANYKSIARTSEIFFIDVHGMGVKNGIYIDSSNRSLKNFQDPVSLTEEELDKFFLHCNHYAIQSYNWFMKVKATRGDVIHVKNCRDENYFRAYDSCGSAIYDDELKRINEKIDSNYPE